MSITLHNPNETARSPRRAILNFTTWSPRTASLIAGIALALMAVLMGVGYFGTLVPLITPGNAAKTAKDISDSRLLFLSGVATLFLVTILDIVVAGAWYTLFRTVNRGVSAAAAWIRVVFAAVFMVAIGQLVNAFTLLAGPDQALRAIEDFTTIWVTGLGLFGIYLLLIGYLAYRSGFMARIFGILLAIAGLGYLADAFGVMFIADFRAVFGQFLFLGEVAVIFWLFIRGRRLPTH